MSELDGRLSRAIVGNDFGEVSGMRRVYARARVRTCVRPCVDCGLLVIPACARARGARIINPSPVPRLARATIEIDATSAAFTRGCPDRDLCESTRYRSRPDIYIYPAGVISASHCRE